MQCVASAEHFITAHRPMRLRNSLVRTQNNQSRRKKKREHDKWRSRASEANTGDRISDSLSVSVYLRGHCANSDQMRQTQIIGSVYFAPVPPTANRIACLASKQGLLIGLLGWSIKITMQYRGTFVGVCLACGVRPWLLILTLKHVQELNVLIFYIERKIDFCYL